MPNHTQLEHVELFLYAERGFPVTSKIRIPNDLVRDYDALFAQARAAYPAYTHEALVRYIWTAGLNTLRKNASLGQIPSPNRPAPMDGKALTPQAD